MVGQQVVDHTSLPQGNSPAPGIVVAGRHPGGDVLLVVRPDVDGGHPADHLLDQRPVAVKQVQRTFQVRCTCTQAAETARKWPGRKPGLRDSFTDDGIRVKAFLRCKFRNPSAKFNEIRAQIGQFGPLVNENDCTHLTLYPTAHRESAARYEPIVHIKNVNVRFPTRLQYASQEKPTGGKGCPLIRKKDLLTSTRRRSSPNSKTTPCQAKVIRRFTKACVDPGRN